MADEIAETQDCTTILVLQVVVQLVKPIPFTHIFHP